MAGKEQHRLNRFLFSEEPRDSSGRVKNKKELRLSTQLLDFQTSGYQDSNLGPPAPKAGALAGLRYTPK